MLEKVRAFWRERLDVGGAVLARGIARGELPPDVDADLAIESFLGPIYLRVLLSGYAVDGALLERLVDLLLAGINGLHR